MNKTQVLICTLVTLMISACSPQEMISDLANTSETQTSGQNVDQAEAMKAKQNRIQQKKDTFAQTVELGLVQTDVEATGIAFRNNFDSDGSTVIHIEATLPDLDRGYYEAWLAGDNPEETMLLNALSYFGPDDYVLEYSSDQDYSMYQTIFITVESQADDIPEERVLIGSFNTN